MEEGGGWEPNTSDTSSSWEIFSMRGTQSYSGKKTNYVPSYDASVKTESTDSRPSDFRYLSTGPSYKKSSHEALLGVRWPFVGVEYPSKLEIERERSELLE